MNSRLEPDRDQTLLNKLLSVITHEISNCSQTILLVGQLLEDFWLDVEGVLARHSRESGDFIAGGIPFARLQQEMPDYLSAVVENAGRIDSLVLELKSLFRAPEAPGAQQVDLSAVARSVKLLTAHMLQKAGLELSLQAADRLPVVAARSRDLTVGLVALIQQLCQAGGQPNRAVSLRTWADASAGTVLCELRLPSEAQLSEEAIGESNRRLFAPNGGSLEMRREGGDIEIRLSFPAAPAEAGGDGL